MMEKEYVLITGSSSGMGEDIAIRMSEKYNIIINGRSQERLEKVKAKLSQGNHYIWDYDLEDVSTIEESIINFISEKGINISYFVHSAGFMKTVPLKMSSVKIYQSSYNINVISAALIIKNLVNRKNNNSFLKSAVLISSNISNFGAKAFSSYSSSKAGLDGLMRSLAVELAPKVRINSVLPGGVRTRMTEHMYQDEELIQRIASTYPLGLGEVQDIAEATMFLLSDKAKWITGQQITVDGGRTINITG